MIHCPFVSSCVFFYCQKCIMSGSFWLNLYWFFKLVCNVVSFVFCSVLFCCLLLFCLVFCFEFLSCVLVFIFSCGVSVGISSGVFFLSLLLVNQDNVRQWDLVCHWSCMLIIFVTCLSCSCASFIIVVIQQHCNDFIFPIQIW